MPQSKEVHREYMRARRKGSQTKGSQEEGSQTIIGGKKEILVNVEEAAKLLMVCNALDRTVTGLTGQRINLLSLVRYGISGPTMADIKAQLT